MPTTSVAHMRGNLLSLVALCAIATSLAGCRCSPGNPSAVTLKIVNPGPQPIYVDATRGTLGLTLKRDVGGTLYAFDDSRLPVPLVRPRVRGLVFLPGGGAGFDPPDRSERLGPADLGRRGAGVGGDVVRRRQLPVAGERAPQRAVHPRAVLLDAGAHRHHLPRRRRGAGAAAEAGAELRDEGLRAAGGRGGDWPVARRLVLLAPRVRGLGRAVPRRLVHRGLPGERLPRAGLGVEPADPQP